MSISEEQNESIVVTQTGTGAWLAEAADSEVSLAATAATCDDAIDTLRLRLAEYHGVDPADMSVTLIGPSTTPGGQALERAIAHTEAALTEVDAMKIKLEKIHNSLTRERSDEPTRALGDD